MTQLLLPLVQAHRNQQLFADHVLNSVLPQRADWRALAGEAEQALERIAPLVNAFRGGAEAETEYALVRPVLEALGHTLAVQRSLKTAYGVKRPDYLLCRDAAARAGLPDEALDDAMVRGRAVAVADAKAWDRSLDTALRAAAGDSLSAHPAVQIAFYIQHSGLAWGILTNGRLWRLYHANSAHKLERYYEVDLPALIERGDRAAFLYFYAFFRRAAFDDGPLALTPLLDESARYARGVGEQLKRQVYGALRHVAQGFLDYPANGLHPDPATLKLIFDHGLILLYRLLFVLYAEARGLLPLRESLDYREEYSLAARARDIARRSAGGARLLPTTARVWQRLKDLFHIIDAGSPPLQVATFNGGLFDARRHPFLDRYAVDDAHLQEAIDLLARVDGAFVDYRDLAERHLGTIYEGLLEHHLQPIAAEDGWTIDLFNDRGERHRTGSYYTPDFVVQYIVEQTLRPMLEAAVAGKTSNEQRIAAVLSLNVLDPAMGSGHFLVAATEYIARFLVDLGAAPGAEAGVEADLAYWKRRVAQSCIYGVDLNPLAVDLAKLSLWLATAAKDRPLSFLDHHLRCGCAVDRHHAGQPGGAADDTGLAAHGVWRRDAGPEVGGIRDVG